MKCQSLFLEINKKNIINLLSAELAQRMIKFNKLGFEVSKRKIIQAIVCDVNVSLSIIL